MKSECLYACKNIVMDTHTLCHHPLVFEMAFFAIRLFGAINEYSWMRGNSATLWANAS